MLISEDIWDAVFEKDPQIVTRKIAGETILVPIRGKLADMEQIYTLNNVGAYIWEQIEEKKPREVIDTMVLVFDVDAKTARQDISDFVFELMEAGLIHEAAA